MKIINKKKLIFMVGGIVLLLIGIIIAVIVSANSKKVIPKKEEKEDKPVEVKKVNIVDLESNTRPYAVMINNIGDARRVQSGLSEAYIVYEIIVEGGITRYLALFKDADTAKIGSVRSARHYYLDYVLENDAIYVHWGWSPQAQEDIRSLGINNINGLTYEGTYFYRDNPLGLSTEHTGFTDMERLKNATERLKYRTETDGGLLLNYSADSIDLSKYGNPEEATDVTISYSNYTNNQYKYDADTKLYKRYVNNKEQNDYATGKQLTVKNIIVYDVKNYTIAGDSKGRQFLENVGSGNGYFISEGKSIKITWSKKDRKSKTVYTFENGENLVVNDGNTFIQIMPLTGNLVIE